MDPTSGQRLVAIAQIIQDAKRWDKKMTKRQEPLTKAMVAHLEEQTAQQPIDSHDRALVDWAKTGLATGYRGVEWCQYKVPKTDADIHRATNPQCTIYAVTAHNVVFKDNRNRPISSPPEAIPLKKMGGVEIEWDIQKNGDHREHRLFTADQSSLQYFAQPVQHIQLYCAHADSASPTICRWQSTNVSLLVSGHPTSPTPQ
jgi:hypothetical protein